MTGTSKRSGFDEATDELVLTIGGKRYVIPPVGYVDGLLLSAQDGKTPEERQARLEALTPAEQHQMYLGSALEEMLEDGVGYKDVVRASNAAVVWFGFDLEQARKAWETGELPEALAAAMNPNRASRRQASRGSTSTAAARSTVKRASGRATTSRRKS